VWLSDIDFILALGPSNSLRLFKFKILGQQITCEAILEASFFVSVRPQNEAQGCLTVVPEDPTSFYLLQSCTSGHRVNHHRVLQFDLATGSLKNKITLTGVALQLTPHGGKLYTLFRNADTSVEFYPVSDTTLVQQGRPAQDCPLTDAWFTSKKSRKPFMLFLYDPAKKSSRFLSHAVYGKHPSEPAHRLPDNSGAGNMHSWTVSDASSRRMMSIGKHHISVSDQLTGITYKVK
jgi:hypothetical protein